ncbi:hypothetical protein DRN73_04955 [Candidatus Pacearchaeota archaeon]|nr:MAG: hypothetical protein DRN73_04955 [Candidatus Pacearchaeota archaeon]
MEFDFNWAYPSFNPFSGEVLAFGEAFVNDLDRDEENFKYVRVFLDFKRPIINFGYEGNQLFRFLGKTDFYIRFNNEDISGVRIRAVAENKLVNSLLPLKRDVFYVFSRDEPFLDVDVWDGKVQEVYYTRLFHAFIDLYKDLFSQKQNLALTHDGDFFGVLKRFKDVKRRERKGFSSLEAEERAKKDFIDILLR